MTGILLSTTVLSRISKAARDEVIEAFLEELNDLEPADAPDEAEGFVSGAAAIDFTSEQAAEFLSRCAHKTRQVLIEILTRPEAGFLISEIAKAMGEKQPGRLRGVWGGLTKRTRTISGLDDAQLFRWTKHGPDWHGQLSKTTFASFKALLVK